MSIPVTTYEEMDKSRTTYQESYRQYKKSYFNFLNTVLEETGFRDKLVQLKDTNIRGQFRVDDNPYTSQPYEIKFFPCRKSDGQISLKSKYLNNIRPWDEKTLVEQLKNIAEVVGDLP